MTCILLLAGISVLIFSGILLVDGASVIDIWMSLAFATLVAVFAFTKKLHLSRWEGGVLLGGVPGLYRLALL